ncbi:carboxypeptidase-like regulatory domain-containing protein [Winogradskyella psychrotolerans]|uniref:carboxypeptidase-like regulatory domain-containing protein n=1 Tax=Winogradskyella psychrotolerans TaxID=1344585 RepID=UPI001C07972D|nr:carboxypeptidase-like regulatory domain-containing protein [Winogradskyella psychrotolerans]MBU2928406.1 carboxypeptidase-like regulatory domain-containing protein [Winogradskyella psychrotolerans]
MPKKSILFSVVFICYASIAMSQGAVELFCRVVDSNEKFPVSYATIQFEGESSGLVANDEGSFRLPGHFVQTNKRIIISSIGYEKLVISINSLDSKKINIIYLKPKIESLDAVMVTSSKSNRTITESSMAIIKKAIFSIPSNYPNQSHSYIGYYRDYQYVNDNYYNLNEGIIENFDSGFDTNKLRYKDNQTALYSYQLNTDFYQDTLLLNSIYGISKIIDTDDNARLGVKSRNELEILNIHNPIRNYNKSSFSFIYVLKDDFITNHRFESPKVVYIGDELLYEIDFYSNEDIQSKFRVKGKIYIAKSNYAIHRLNYHMFENQNYSTTRTRTPSFGFNSQKSDDSNTLFKINIEYKKVEGKMYLNYMTFNNRFIIKEPNPLRVDSFDFDVEKEAFYITFNKSIDDASIQSKNRIKLYFKDEKLMVSSIKLVKNNVVKIEVVDWAAGTKFDIGDVQSEDFAYKLKKIRDVSGVTIYKESKLLGFQFREFFTQDIFTDQPLKSDLILVNKTMPLSSSGLNSKIIDVNTYWVNTPLKSTSEVKP